MSSDELGPFLSLARRGGLILDGAMGTSVHALDLPLSDYNGLENCTEILNFTRPDAVERIHRDFLEVGCDAVETNTFGGMKHVLAEFGLQDRCRELNVQAARIARRAADACSTPDRPRFVVGSMGPGTKLVTLRQIDYDAMLDSYFEQAVGLLEGGVDALLIETCQDILQTKVAIEAVRRAWDRAGRRTPLMCQVTMETTGTMLMGTEMAAAIAAIEAYPEVDVIGLNCATGPQEMSEHIRLLGATTSRLISVLPNAGLPQVVNGQPHFPLSPGELARWLKEFVEIDGVSIVGGCCGTTPAHLAAVVRALRPPGGPAPRRAERKPIHDPGCTSLYSATPYRQDNSFLIVGERCNTNGSKKFKELLVAGDVEGMLETASEQVREGAHVLDVCVDYVGRDGVSDMRRVIDRFASSVTVPLMLDSTEVPVIEAGLKLAGGKCIVNSVNLEDGEEKMSRVCRLLRQFGAAVVALTIDEDPVEAMGKTAARKLAIATRIYDLLTAKYGIAEEDIFFDCLTFPITTGNPEDRRLALETLDAIEQLTRNYPRVQTILGVSNVSFGLLPAARAVLNSAFLSEACARGLTAAIVHAGKILPRNKISEQRWQAALDLIYDRRSEGEPDPLERFIGLFSAGETVGEKTQIAALPIEQRLSQRIVDGARVGLEADIDEALKQYAPLHIINTFLLDGMKVVGELFGSGQMQLPFVLKSAEVMKAAVARLEPHMEKVDGQSRGRMVLATVRGDVHDIGKNLVDIILSNNGYTIYNLGIKQPISNIIHALREHNAEAIGLSGLLVKSTLVMREDLQVLNEQDIRVPVVLGGAALTRQYVEHDLRRIYKGPLYYAKDAFDGLRLMEQICRGDATPPPAREAELVAAAVPAESADRASELDHSVPTLQKRNLEKLSREVEQRYGLAEIDDDAEGAAPPAPPHSDIGHDHPVPRPPFWGARVLEKIALKAALAYLNETMLFQVQWGFRKKGRSPQDWKKYVNAEIRPIYRDLVERCERESILLPQAIYGYWPANSDGDSLLIFEPPGGALDRPEQHGPEVARFTFPRQKKHPYWCLADFWRPVSMGVTDVAAFSLVTAGARVSDIARQWFAESQYQQYLFLHGLGVETAEALAEYVHKQVRVELGVAERDARELQMLFKQGYQGSRYSFGYPACPRLEDQAPLMRLLAGERIGVTLSDEFQLDPEQSTSALIAYHPAARYFNVR